LFSNTALEKDLPIVGDSVSLCQKAEIKPSYELKSPVETENLEISGDIPVYLNIKIDSMNIFQVVGRDVRTISNENVSPRELPIVPHFGQQVYI